MIPSTRGRGMRFGVLTAKFSFLAKDIQYMVSPSGEDCRGSVWILLVAGSEYDAYGERYPLGG